MFLLLTLLVASLSGTERAWAQAKHDKVSVTPLRAGGKVVGAAIRVVMTPAQFTSYSTVRLGLGKAKANLSFGSYLAAVSDPAKGYILHRFKAEAAKATPVERTYKVIYGEGNTLHGGEAVEVFSVWDGKGRSHVWGASRCDDRVATYVLPK